MTHHWLSTCWQGIVAIGLLVNVAQAQPIEPVMLEFEDGLNSVMTETSIQSNAIVDYQVEV